MDADDDLERLMAETGAQADHAIEQGNRRRQALEWANSQIAAVEGTAASADGLIRATVDQSGMLVGLELSPRVRTAKPEDLSDAIIVVAQRAVANARSQIRETYANLQNEGVIREVPEDLPRPPSVRNVSVPLQPEPSPEPASDWKPAPSDWQPAGAEWKPAPISEDWRQSTPVDQPEPPPAPSQPDEDGPPETWLDRKTTW
ncbi:YbaB/EbfC family nucleoid-associated protein [Saccharopolyspora taberi]|uniref:YbaB/EbfC family nucleoid-associated protein n=1 Tax=Saccharopolyspora taberi TaxID=60895 RepID=UPI0031CDC701